MVRKYEGPLQPGKRTAKVPQKKAKKALTKGQKKETKSIVEKTIDKKAQSKFFDCKTVSQLSGINQAGMVLSPARGTYTQMYVIGFAAGQASVAGTTLQYGMGSMESIQHGRVHPDGHVDNQQLKGEFCRPDITSTTFDIQRVVENSDISNGLARGQVPYMVRMIRVYVKPLKGSSVAVEPKNDLFFNQANQETGIHVDGFEHYDLLFNKVNTRKYTVKQDIKFMLTPPLTHTEVASGSTLANSSELVGNISRGCHKSITCKHNLGSKFFYENPLTRSFPTDGFKNEFIFFHVIPIGVQNDGNVIPSTIRIAARAISTFKDF